MRRTVHATVLLCSVNELDVMSHCVGQRPVVSLSGRCFAPSSTRSNLTTAAADDDDDRCNSARRGPLRLNTDAPTSNAILRGPPALRIPPLSHPAIFS